VLYPSGQLIARYLVDDIVQPKRLRGKIVAWSKVLSFADPFPYQRAIPAADLELFPTTRGEFRAELTQICFNQLWMQRAHESLPRVWVGAIRPGRKVIGFLTGTNSPGLKHCGMQVAIGDIIVNDADLMHRRTEGACDWGAMSLTLDDFDAACKAITGYELPRVSLTHLFRPGAAIMSRLLSLHERVGKIARTTPDILVLPTVERALEQQLIHLMIRCLTEGESRERTSGSFRRERVVARFEKFLEANAGRALYLAEVCAAIGVAERTLRVACEEHLGMGPIRYLTLRRMHLVRRALLRADISTTTVTQLATDHGFWELGHFSVAYRALFGEAPSESLRRPQDDYRKIPSHSSPPVASYWHSSERRLISI
jgi:AraC-like DNA-binding protein